MGKMPAGLSLEEQYRELIDLGFDGIKLLETKAEEQKYFGFRVDDEGFEPFFAQCEKDGTPIVWHVADPDSFWDLNRIHPRHLAKGWYYGEGDYLSWQEIYDMVFRVLERHPKLKVTFAHFFFWSPWPEKLEELFETYEHVTVDITPGAEMYGFFRDQYQRYRDFFIRYADRILYGTDVSFPSSKTNSLRPEQVYRFLTTDEELTLVDIPTRGLNLPEEVCQRILYRNFEDMTGLAPKPVDRAKLRAYIQKYLPYISHGDVLAHIREQLELL
jgi:predicted TIM-barrel fold metal-dependent hydrolase